MITFIHVKKKQPVITWTKDKVKLQVLSLLASQVRSCVNVWNRKGFTWHNAAQKNGACTVLMPTAAPAAITTPPGDQWGWAQTPFSLHPLVLQFPSRIPGAVLGDGQRLLREDKHEEWGWYSPPVKQTHSNAINNQTQERLVEMMWPDRGASFCDTSVQGWI